MPTTRKPHPERQRVIDYLASFGLDAGEISGAFTDQGFELVRGSVSRHPWPDGFNYEWFTTAVEVARKADLRRAGIRV